MKVPCCSPPRIKAEWADNRQQSLNHCSDDEDDDEFDEVDEENGSGDSAVITYKDLFRMATLGGATGTCTGLDATQVCRYSWHSAGSLGWPSAVLTTVSYTHLTLPTILRV